MNTKKITTIVIILIILGGFAVYYSINKKQGTNIFTRKTTSTMPSKTEILSRLTAPLNRQSSSVTIKDIKADLNATDLMIIDEGIKK
jgi:LEA14-like dessication related protein